MNRYDDITLFQMHMMGAVMVSHSMLPYVSVWKTVVVLMQLTSTFNYIVVY